MSTVSLNTHDYDGKWYQELLEVKSRYSTIVLNSFETCLSEIRTEANKGSITYVDSSSSNKNEITVSIKVPSVIATLDLFERKAGNHDTSNNVSVEELLPIAWYNANKDTELKPYFYEQLADIFDSGSCPQGRTTRLFQICRCIV